MALLQLTANLTGVREELRRIADYLERICFVMEGDLNKPQPEPVMVTSVSEIMPEESEDESMGIEEG